MRIWILTLFPEYFDSILSSSILHRAQESQKVEYKLVNIRDFSTDLHRKADDRPFGGGPGMVMMVEPIDRALSKIGVEKGGDRSRIILTSAKGKEFNQSVAQEYSNLEDLVLICGHYEGVDERVAEHLVDEEMRIGNYVLTGGEAGAAVITDAVVRLIPGVLGNQESTQEESHHKPGVMGYPQYTRPSLYRGWSVPNVLLSGNHADINAWREEKRSKD